MCVCVFRHERECHESNENDKKKENILTYKSDYAQ